MGTNWLPSEELQLCVSWARQSVDPITSRYSNKNNLWGRIHDDYAKNWCGTPENPHAEPRSKVALDSHWTPLKRALKKWQCAKNQASRYSASGTNLVDEITQAQGLYFKEMNKTFDKWECYEAVAAHPQFIDVPTTSPPFQQNFPTQMDSPPINLNSDDCVDEEGFTTPESNRETESPSSPVRPMGVKASKHAKKKGKQRMTEKEEMSIAIFNNMQCHQKQLVEANIKRDEETLQMSREMLELEKRKEARQARLDALEERKEARLAKHEAIEELREQTKIMTMDTSQMTPNTKKWFKRKKAEIMEQVNETTTGSAYVPRFDDDFYD
ncbi:uncharacterized protein LOC141703451 [Apium graveolens]|uniref:uncharacterized protein LOC141703451 n=1 Tax=Apium graveolens TaxID=4045 RepID=UPI003D7A41AD